jgi:hypothetical protein
LQKTRFLVQVLEHNQDVLADAERILDEIRAITPPLDRIEPVQGRAIRPRAGARAPGYVDPQQPALRRPGLDAQVVLPGRLLPAQNGFHRLDSRRPFVGRYTPQYMADQEIGGHGAGPPAHARHQLLIRLGLLDRNLDLRDGACQNSFSESAYYSVVI